MRFRILMPLQVYQVDSEDVMQPVGLIGLPLNVKSALAEIAWSTVMSVAKLGNGVSIIAEFDEEEGGGNGD